jgi:predicted metal-dependent phosphoesterase TrpH
VLIDLHVHSAASDGTEPPSQVVASALAARVDLFALTDHDTTAGWHQALAAAEGTATRVIPGAEISCASGSTSVHLLAYRFDPEDEPLRAAITATRADRDGRARRIVAALAEDYPLSWDDVAEQVSPGATVGRPHIADALVALGIVADRDAAFAGMLARDGGYYHPYRAPDVLDTVRLVAAAGGVSVLAHGLAGRRGEVVSDDVIAAMAGAGMAGLEVDHRDHDASQRAHLRGLAAELGLLVTGGSDYHGAGKQNRLGEHGTSPAVLEALLGPAVG